MFVRKFPHPSQRIYTVVSLYYTPPQWKPPYPVVELPFLPQLTGLVRFHARERMQEYPFSGRICTEGNDQPLFGAERKQILPNRFMMATIFSRDQHIGYLQRISPFPSEAMLHSESLLYFTVMKVRGHSTPR